MKELIDEVGQQNDSVHTQATGKIAVDKSPPVRQVVVDATGMALISDIKIHRGSDDQVHVTLNGHTLPASGPVEASKKLSEYLGCVFVK